MELIDSQSIGPYMTQLQFQPKRRVGHFDFELFLKSKSGCLSFNPLIKGIYSRGNLSWKNQGWLDIHYADYADFGEEKSDILSESDQCAEQMFQMMAKTIQPGGMIFVSLVTDIVWDVEITLHRITRECLSRRSLVIPPVATPIGRLIFMSGCRSIKSQAFDVQGSSRLAGEKAPDTETGAQFSQSLEMQLREYLGRTTKDEFSHLEEICRANAVDVLQRL